MDELSPDPRLLERFGRKFHAGDVIFREGESGNEAFLLQEGRVRLLKKVRTVERSGWILGVWRNTWPSLAFSLAVAVAFGLYAKLEVPGANTLFEVFMKGN